MSEFPLIGAIPDEFFAEPSSVMGPQAKNPSEETADRMQRIFPLNLDGNIARKSSNYSVYQRGYYPQFPSIRGFRQQESSHIPLPSATVFDPRPALSPQFTESILSRKFVPPTFVIGRLPSPVAGGDFFPHDYVPVVLVPPITPAN